MGIYVELNNFEVPKRLIYLKAPIYYQAPDYAAMVRELCEHHDLTHERIAYLLPISGASTVSEWTKGGHPNLEAGAAFIELWKMLTDKDDKDIPRNNHWSL